MTIDLSRFETPGGKEELVKELEYAVTKVGKFGPKLSTEENRYTHTSAVWLALCDE